MSKPKMRVTEISVGLSGVIPVAAYENLRPSFNITVEPLDGENPDKIIVALREYLHRMMTEESNRCKAEWVEKLYQQIRFYERAGQKYPSVTAILGLDKNWGNMTEDDLLQYASRGTIIDRMCQVFIETGEWLDPENTPSLKEDVAILKSGSRQLHWDQCSHKVFLEKFKDKIVVEEFQKTIYNDEHLYAGTTDCIGLFDGVYSVMDWKTGTYDFAQLAAYAACLPNVKQLVVLPVGPTDNKQGYKKPVICETIGKEFKKFLNARAKFKQRFGI